MEGGSVLYHKAPRSVAISLPTRGWRRGLYLICTYAPTSSSGLPPAWEALRRSLDILLNMCPATAMPIILEDLNAELGNNSAPNIAGSEVVGPFSSARISHTGAEWREWASRMGMADVASRTEAPARHLATLPVPLVS